MKANQVTRVHEQSQGQDHPRGQGQASSSTAGAEARVSFESLPSKLGFGDVRFENEAKNEKEAATEEEEFEEIKDKDLDGDEGQSDTPRRPRLSVRDRAKQFAL